MFLVEYFNTFIRNIWLNGAIKVYCIIYRPYNKIIQYMLSKKWFIQQLHCKTVLKGTFNFPNKQLFVCENHISVKVKVIQIWVEDEKFKI